MPNPPGMHIRYRVFFPSTSVTGAIESLRLDPGEQLLKLGYFSQLLTRLNDSIYGSAPDTTPRAALYTGKCCTIDRFANRGFVHK